MKKIVLVLFALVLISSLAIPQRARINVEQVTPHSLTTLGLTTNSVSNGLRVIPNQTYAYFSAQNMASLTDPVTSATFQLMSKPAGSTATLEILTSPNWTLLKPDVKGEYQIKLTITTALGTDDTTASFFAADYVGVGNFDGVAGSFPKCMTCHASMPAFTAIFDTWKVSGHGTTFKDFATSDPTFGHFGPSCFKCHTTGSDKNLIVSNGGFDDVASTLGWTWSPSNPLKWDTIKTQYSGLVNLATVGCESCHGAGSEHANGGAKAKIEITFEAGNCASCHDEEPYYPEYQQYENSLHAEAIWETGFATRGIANPSGLSDCMRCHSGKGFVLFTKGLASTTPVSPTWAEHTHITCATCHDPHGNNNHAALRKAPASSDTLGTGFNYSSIGGNGQLCMNCHKARRNNVVYVPTNVSSTWGPHYNTETDVFLGKNAYSFGSTYASTSHSSAITNSCVECHMGATDTSAVNKNKVGGHSFRFTNPNNGFELTKACESCHGPKTSFDDFVAFMDYDGDGVIESIRNEVKGLLTNIAMKIPPLNVDSISWTGIRASSDSVLLKKAWWNYQLIQKGSAYGMHNAKYAIDVLSKTYAALGGVIPVELLSFSAEMSDGLVALHWETATETNNRGFEIQRKTGNYDWQTVGFVNGKGTTTEMSKYSYTDNPVGITNYAKLNYRLKQLDYDGKVNYSKEINIEFTGAPKTFSLEQNYPNPFNPATVIRYAVPTESKVKVIVYNLSGEVVKELVNEVQSAGFHESTFSTNSGLSLASGIYFYSIEATPLNGNNAFRQTKKMILMK